jgi:hypothetical protein
MLSRSRPIRLLYRPIVLSQASIENVRLRSNVVPPLPLQVRNRRLTLLSSISSLPGSAVTCIKVRPELRQTSVEQRIVFC